MTGGGANLKPGLERARAILARRWAAAGLLAWCLVFSVTCRASLASAEFESANKLYEEGKFAEAAAAYEKLVRSGEASTAVYFNLGNAFFRSGRMGRAIAAYRQAERLAPRDPDIRANLQFARNQVQAPTLRAGRGQRWLGKLSVNEWTLLTAAFTWTSLLLLAAMQLRPAAKPALRGVVMVTGPAAILLGICLAVSYQLNSLARTAIVIAPDAVVRHGPLPESQSAFTAQDGAELRVLDQKDDWLRVTAGPQHTGWVRRDQVFVLPPA
jgi:tetratricopeptide (TPR) repeat protein